MALHSGNPDLQPPWGLRPTPPLGSSTRLSLLSKCRFFRKASSSPSKTGFNVAACPDTLSKARRPATFREACVSVTQQSHPHSFPHSRAIKVPLGLDTRCPLGPGPECSRCLINTRAGQRTIHRPGPHSGADTPVTHGRRTTRRPAAPRRHRAGPATWPAGPAPPRSSQEPHSAPAPKPTRRRHLRLGP